MSNRRVILIIIDSLGIGAMKDVNDLRVNDIGANTYQSVISNSEIKLLNLNKLGISIFAEEPIYPANYLVASSNLKHFGADSFFGHQEMFGTDPIAPVTKPFNDYIVNVEKKLDMLKVKHERIKTEQGYILLIEDSFTLADNVETDPGQAYNITADLNKIEFSNVLEIAKEIRKVINVPRLIVFGGKDTSIARILSCQKTTAKGYIGIDAPCSGVYTDTYECVHLGHGVIVKEQIVEQLYRHQIYPYFIGKVGDIISNPKGINVAEVDTQTLMQKTLEQVKENNSQFIATNIQETDLAGHGQDVEKYARKLQIVDNYLGKIINNLKKDDLLIVTADHGNDPMIGHPQHTREKVPILFYPNEGYKRVIATRDTLADIGSTVVNYLVDEDTINGEKII